MKPTNKQPNPQYLIIATTTNCLVKDVPTTLEQTRSTVRWWLKQPQTRTIYVKVDSISYKYNAGDETHAAGWEIL